MTPSDRFAATQFEMRPEVAAAYRKFMRDHNGEIELPLLCETMWNAGAREMERIMVQFADVPGVLQRCEAAMRKLTSIVEERYGQ